MKKDNVTIICYGRKDEMDRQKAKEFYLDCMLNSEGSEQNRYTKIYLELCAGYKVCTDEDD